MGLAVRALPWLGTNAGLPTFGAGGFCAAGRPRLPAWQYAPLSIPTTLPTATSRGGGKSAVVAEPAPVDPCEARPLGAPFVAKQCRAGTWIVPPPMRSGGATTRKEHFLVPHALGSMAQIDTIHRCQQSLGRETPDWKPCLKAQVQEFQGSNKHLPHHEKTLLLETTTPRSAALDPLGNARMVLMS